VVRSACIGGNPLFAILLYQNLMRGHPVPRRYLVSQSQSGNVCPKVNNPRVSELLVLEIVPNEQAVIYLEYTLQTFQ
jgi:hypothetical protein